MRLAPALAVPPAHSAQGLCPHLSLLLLSGGLKAQVESPQLILIDNQNQDPRTGSWRPCPQVSLELRGGSDTFPRALCQGGLALRDQDLIWVCTTLAVLPVALALTCLGPHGHVASPSLSQSPGTGKREIWSCRDLLHRIQVTLQNSVPGKE